MSSDGGTGETSGGGEDDDQPQLEGWFELDGDTLDDDLSDPRWAHYQPGVANEFEVEPLGGSPLEDVAEIEAEFGSGVWDGEQTYLAEDITDVRYMQRTGEDFGLFGSLVGADAIREMQEAAWARGDDEAAWELEGEHWVADPERFLGLMRGLQDAIANPNPDDDDFIAHPPGCGPGDAEEYEYDPDEE